MPESLSEQASWKVLLTQEPEIGPGKTPLKGSLACRRYTADLGRNLSVAVASPFFGDFAYHCEEEVGEDHES